MSEFQFFPKDTGHRVHFLETTVAYRHQDLLPREPCFVQRMQVIDRQLCIRVWGGSGFGFLYSYHRCQSALLRASFGNELSLGTVVTGQLDIGHKRQLLHRRVSSIVHLAGSAIEPTAVMADLGTCFTQFVQIHRTDRIIHIVVRDTPFGTLFYCPRR